MTKNISASPATDVPQNGLAGLKHWRQDIVAGLIVALVSVPLSLGIALASGAPPICGLTSEIIAGLIFPFLGGAYVTISGPAAGLAPVLYSSILALGKGDMESGYRLVLAAIMLAGVTQLILTKLKAARFSYLIPRVAVQGMLASIGLLILTKQIPHFIGHKYQAHEFFGVVVETPAQLLHLNPVVFAISSICLALLFILPTLKIGFLRFLPPHLLVVLVGIGLAQAFHLDAKYLVQIPENVLQHGIVLPDFQALLADWRLVPTLIVSVFALTFVDGTESLATIHAVDQIDPFRRKSDPHKTLFAMGISNICSSLIGGLTIIPGIIKSTTCIVAGGRTAWVNFYNALFLAAFVLLGHDILRLIPIAALSAVLVHIAYKLAGPHQWQKVIDTGFEQLLIFSTTVLVTVCTDLLIGIGAGILVKLIILLYYSVRSANFTGSWSERMTLFGQLLRRLFANPLDRLEEVDGETRVYFSGPTTCFNNLSVRSALKEAVERSRSVRVVFLPQVAVIDHSSATFFQQMAEDGRKSGAFSLSVEGLEALAGRSDHTACFRYRPQ